MEVNQEVSDMIGESVRESLGFVLKNEREKQDISCREVAEALRVMPYQIEAIEQDDFSGFKADVFAKAYIKNYAKFLELDSEPLLEIYEQQHQAQKSHHTPRKLYPVHMPSKKRYLGIVAVIVVLLLLWMLNSGEDTGSSDSDVQPSSDVTVTVGSEAEILRSESDAFSELKTEVEIDEVTLASTQLIKSTVKDVSVDPVAEESMQDALELAFTADCWVEIRDSEGETLLADLKRSDDRLKIAGKAPFSILLGYAPAVTLSYNGEPVIINSGSRSQSARLVVGGS